MCLLVVVGPQAGWAQPQAFAVRFEAQAAVQQLLEQHLSLMAYRAVPDLSDAELQRLIALAEPQARNLLATMGYFAPDIAIAIAPATATQTQRSVVVAVAAGRQTTVSAVRIGFQGAIAHDPAFAQQRQAIEGSWALPVGVPFTQAQWDQAKLQIARQLAVRRFAAARISHSNADIDPDTHAAQLDVELDSAARYRIGPVKVQGASRYGDALAVRLAQLTEGADYVQSDLLEAQQRLTDSGYYDSAFLSLDLESNPEAATINAVVREADRQKLVFGIGASTDTGARLSLEHTHNQVPGLDWRMVNKFAIDRATTSLSSDWTSLPDERQWRWAVSGLLNTQRIGALDVTGQRYRVGRFVLGQPVDQSYYLQYDRADVSTRHTDDADTNQALSVNYAWTRRALDSLPFTSEGWALGGACRRQHVWGCSGPIWARAGAMASVPALGSAACKRSRARACKPPGRARRGGHCGGARHQRHTVYPVVSGRWRQQCAWLPVARNWGHAGRCHHCRCGPLSGVGQCGVATPHRGRWLANAVGKRGVSGRRCRGQ